MTAAFMVFDSIIKGVTLVNAPIWLARILPAVSLEFEIPAAFGRFWPKKTARFTK